MANMDEALPSPPSRSGGRKPHDRPGFITGMDITSAEERQKQDARAKRFQDVEFDPQTSQPVLDARSKLIARQQKFANTIGTTADDHFQRGQEPQDQRRDVDATATRRWDTVHMFGNMMNMGTSDILKYFEDYGPRKVEWIDDSTCNVVFGDEFSCARALRGLSQAIPSEILALKQRDASYMVDDVPDLPDEKLELICWRGAVNYKAHEQFLLRIASMTDVKLPFNERKPSKYYSQISDAKKQASALRKRRNKRRKRSSHAMKVDNLGVTVTLDPRKMLHSNKSISHAKQIPAVVVQNVAVIEDELDSKSGETQ